MNSDSVFKESSKERVPFQYTRAIVRAIDPSLAQAALRMGPSEEDVNMGTAKL